MRPLERVPAVRRIETDRNDTFAVEITGEFTSADAENLCGLLEGAYALHERLDLLVRIKALDAVDVADMSSETAGFMKDHLARHVGRCAIIDDGGWAERITRIFVPGGDVEIRRFEPEEEPDAWRWLGVREIVQRI